MAKNFLGIGWPNLQVLYYKTCSQPRALLAKSRVIIALGGGYFMLRDKQVGRNFLSRTIAFFAYLLLNSGYLCGGEAGPSGTARIVPMLPFLCLP